MGRLSCVTSSTFAARGILIRSCRALRERYVTAAKQISGTPLVDYSLSQPPPHPLLAHPDAPADSAPAPLQHRRHHELDVFWRLQQGARREPVEAWHHQDAQGP